MPRTRICVQCGEEKTIKGYSCADTFNNFEKEPTCSLCLDAARTASLKAHVAERKRQRELQNAATAQRKQEASAKKYRQKLAAAKVKGQAKEIAKEAAKQQKILNTRAKKVNIAQRELALRKLAAQRLMPFVLRMENDYLPGWVHKDICERLEKFEQDIVNKKSPRLMLQMPPRSGKSQLASVDFPPWYLGRNPQHEVISATYSGSLAIGFSRKVRGVMREPTYKRVFPKVALDKDNQNAEGWMVNAGGGYVPAGVGGAITGKGCHCLIIDDPVKNSEEAESATTRESIKEWYSSTAYTRLAPGGGVLIIQCMTGDTSVTMGDGSRKQLADIRPGDFVTAYEDGRMVSREVLNWAPQGEDEVYEIRTGSSCVRANARHPFLVERDNGTREWVRVKDLAKRDRLVTSALDHRQEHDTLTPKEARLLGYMFGDGWLTQRTGTNYNKQTQKRYARTGIVTCVAVTHREEENEYIKQTFDDLFGIVPKLTKYGYIRTEIQRVGRWFSDRGLNGRAKTKRLPQYLFGESLEVREAFLGGFNHADGAVLSKGLGLGRKSYGSCNEELMRDMRHLARSCGYSPTNISIYHSVQQPPNSPKPIDSINAGFTHHVTNRNNRAFTANTSKSNRIQSIKPAGREMVYDIQVDQAECFIADGLVTHNTRWHSDDLSGWLEAQMHAGEGDNWEIVRYPAIAMEDERFRKKGEALHPARYDEKALKRIERAVGPRVWDALYQQHPVAEDGTYFTKDMINYYTGSPPERMHNYTAWDLAIGKADRNDYTVGVTVGVDLHDNIWVIDVRRGRWDSFEIVEQMLDVHKTYRSQVTGMERGQLSLAIGPYLDQRIQEEKMWDLAVKDMPPGRRDKESRARAIQGRMRQGKVMFPKDADYMPEFRDEMLKFPLGQHDDFVDALAYIGLLLQDMTPPAELKAPDMNAKGWRKQLRTQITSNGGRKHMRA